MEERKMYRNSYSIKAISLLLIIILVSMPMVLIAQDQAETFSQGKMDGERDTRGNAVWILAGIGCGIFGVGAAYFIKPSVPAQVLVGKSSDYVLGYTEGYQNKARNKNAGYACAGWALFVAVYLAAGGFNTSSN